MTEGVAADVAGLVCDLDGVVYAGAEAVPHAIEGLRAAGLPVVYATNNASRRPAEVAEHLRRLGLDLVDDDVVTSSVAGARWLAERLPAGARVMAVGGDGVTAALQASGLVAVAPGTGACVAVLQGYGPEVTARDLGEAAVAIQSGARWVATNDDLTLPTERGQMPGNGSLVGAVRHAVAVDPEVIGKPHAPMYHLAAQRLGVPPERVLAIGDRLETDIAGGTASGTPTALVLTGVHGVLDAAAAPPALRPDLVLRDLRDLVVPYPAAVVDDGWSIRGRARARVHDGELVTEGDGIDLARACLDALWSAQDAGELSATQAAACAASALER